MVRGRCLLGHASRLRRRAVTALAWRHAALGGRPTVALLGHALGHTATVAALALGGHAVTLGTGRVRVRGRGRVRGRIGLDPYVDPVPDPDPNPDPKPNQVTWDMPPPPPPYPPPPP